MTIATAKTSVTPQELLALPNSVNYELVDGQLVKRHMGLESSAIAAVIAILLGIWNKRTKAGHLFTTDAGYECFPDAQGKVRKPDVSFVRKGRFEGEKVPEGFGTVAPDLAVEVLSPNDLAYEIDRKIEEYLGAGVRLIWVVNPQTKTVKIHRPAGALLGSFAYLNEQDTIKGEDVLPDFECRVAEFFDV